MTSKTYFNEALEEMETKMTEEGFDSFSELEIATTMTYRSLKFYNWNDFVLTFNTDDIRLRKDLKGFRKLLKKCGVERIAYFRDSVERLIEFFDAGFKFAGVCKMKHQELHYDGIVDFNGFWLEV